MADSRSLEDLPGRVQRELGIMDERSWLKGGDLSRWRRKNSRPTANTPSLSSRAMPSAGRCAAIALLKLTPPQQLQRRKT